MKKLLTILSICTCLLSQKSLAQSTTLTPGSILPNMTTTQRTEVLNPPNGMMVFDSNTQSYWFRQSGAWVELPKGGSTSNYWELNGANGNELKNTNSGGFWSSNPTVLDPQTANDTSNPPTSPVNGTGTRMMWIPNRSAFRVGTVFGTDWDPANIGLFSVGMGINSLATGKSSFAIGQTNFADGENSTSIGVGNTSAGQYATSIGVENYSEGDASFTIGTGNSVEFNESIAIGNENDINSSFSHALGNENTINLGGGYSVAVGSSNSIDGDYSYSFGDNNSTHFDGAFAIGSNNFAFKGMAIGYNVINKTSNSLALGFFNDTSDNPSNTYATTDRLFQLGNGTGVSRSNAITVLKNGKMGLNNANLPDSPLHIKGIGTNSFSHLVLERSNSIENSMVFTNSTGLNFENSFSPMNFNFRNFMGDIKAVIGNNGFIGSQITSPLAPLHLGNGPETWERHIRLDFNATTNQYGNIVYDSEGMKFRAWGTGDDFYFRNNANTSVARINDDGNMTISGTLTQNSDERLKTNLKKIKDSSAKLNSLNAYHYNWKAEDREKGVQTGLIAQEVQKQFPELVKANEEGYLSVNYIGLIPHLIEAHKELKAENELLKERLSKIEEKLNSSSTVKTQTASSK